MPTRTRPQPQTRAGMGAIPFDGGVTFRVWAPTPTVSVVGTFNEWDRPATRSPRRTAGTGRPTSRAADGDEYRFLVRDGDREMSRIDPGRGG